MGKISQLFTNPRKLYCWATYKGLTRWVDDETHLKLMYRALMGRPLNLDSPKTYNEKLQWIKLHDRCDVYTTMVDKYRSKAWAEERIGSQYIVETYQLWETEKEVSIENLPDSFVLKTNHDNGGVVVCKDKSNFDLESARALLGKHLKRDFFSIGREWPYLNVRPLVFAEELLLPRDGDDLSDYKVMCFNGRPRLIQVHRGRFGHHTQDFFSTDWTKMPFTQGDPESCCKIDRPENLDLMLELSSRLAEGIPQLRIDWFETKSGLKLGEMTFFDGSGFYPFEPEEWDAVLGSWITL